MPTAPLNLRHPGQRSLHSPVSRPADGAVAGLPGTGRPRLLQGLRSRATTISLARSLEVSPWRSPSTSLPWPLRPGDRTRSGRDVLGQTSDLGLAFLDVAPI